MSEEQPVNAQEVADEEMPEKLSNLVGAFKTFLSLYVVHSTEFNDETISNIKSTYKVAISQCFSYFKELIDMLKDIEKRFVDYFEENPVNELPDALQKLVDDFEGNLWCYDIRWNSMDKTDFNSIKDTYGQAFHETISHLEDVVNVFKELRDEFSYYFFTIEEQQ